MRPLALLTPLVLALAIVPAASARSAACVTACFVEVQAERFKAVGAGASGATTTMTVGATVTWRVPVGAPHSVVGSNGLFRFGTFSDEVDLSFSLTPSAGQYGYRDTLGRAGRGTLVVQPRFERAPDGGQLVTWAAPGTAPSDRVHDVRFLLVRGADVIDTGTWQHAGKAGSRVVSVASKRTSTARSPQSLCVEVRTGRGAPTRWSGWASACTVL